MYIIERVHTFHWVDRYGCAGLKIRLRWTEDSISLGYRFDFIGWKSQFRWLNNMAALAERSSSVSWMKHLSYQNEALELSESELSHVVQERAEGPKAPSPGRVGQNLWNSVWMIWLGIIGIIRFASLLGDPPERLTEERAYPVLRIFYSKKSF